MAFKPDWLYLRPALIIMSTALLFAILIKLLGVHYYQEALAQYDQKNAEYNEINTALATLREEQKMIVNFKESFNHLVKEGLFDSKQRIEWVDTVNNARRKMKLPLVRYQISPQTSYSAKYLPVDEHVNVMSSLVKLDAGLLHEGDLVYLFKQMDNNAPGQLHLSQCKLIRIEKVFGYFSAHPNMNVTCEFSWLRVAPLQEVLLNG